MNVLPPNKLNLAQREKLNKKQRKNKAATLAKGDCKQDCKWLDDAHHKGLDGLRWDDLAC